jgi:6-phosphofructokinase 1
MPVSAHAVAQATTQGYAAIKAVLDPKQKTSPIIGMVENKIIRLPLMEAVKQVRIGHSTSASS